MMAPIVNMDPQHLKAVLSSGLLSFPVTDFDARAAFGRRRTGRGSATAKGQDSDVYRVWIADRRLERAWRAEGFVGEGYASVPWLGLVPDGSLLSMRSATTRAIYAFDWEAP